jgi:hypothetical protein
VGLEGVVVDARQRVGVVDDVIGLPERRLRIAPLEDEVVGDAKSGLMSPTSGKRVERGARSWSVGAPGASASSTVRTAGSGS